MASQPAADPREATARLEKELLTRLGLGSGASNEQIEGAHEEIASYLDKAPAALRDWATRQSAGIDEAYALLRGSRDDLKAAALARAAAAAVAAPAVEALPAAEAAASAAPRVPQPRPAAKAEPGVVLPHGGRHNMDALDSEDTWYDESELQPRASNTRHAREARAAAAATRGPGINPTLKRLGIALGAVVAAVAIGFGGYNLGSPKATPAPAADTDQAAFQAEVGGLMQKLAQNPQDIPTLMGLANAYYAVSDYATAATWVDKVLAIDPRNVDALLAVGAVSFNQSDYESAETSWKKVLEIDAKNLEAYYDLGFLYFSDNPPDTAKVKEMWGKLVEISPDSNLAKTVSSHLASLDSIASGAPSTAPGSSPAPSPATSAGPSAAASPAPSK